MLSDIAKYSLDVLREKADAHEVDADIETVNAVLNAPLTIPPYQRPYMWEEKQVLQLLDDIKSNKENTESSDRYRIGSLITCVDPSLAENTVKEHGIDIVDGQQRITTLLLILHCLKPSFANGLFAKLKYNHSQSYKHLRRNKESIEEWIASNVDSEKDVFFKYILENCELVVVTVYNISEAFQMFDSQNGNGKDLEPYNLLKAYHLSAIDDYNEQKKYDIEWENAVKNRLTDNQNIDLLKQLFSEQLYKSRVWSKGDCAYRFAKKNIDEFKGYRTKRGIQYPYQNKTLSLLMFSEWMKQQNGVTKGMIDRDGSAADENFIKNFMNVNQDIVDGSLFFQYVETYVAMYKRLFLEEHESGPLQEFRKFYKDNCFYKGHGRIGDTYLRELFKALVFCFYDKFGIKGFLPQYYKILYAFVYRIRILNKSVFYNTVAKAPIESQVKPFSVIAQAQKPGDIKEIQSACCVKKNILEQLKRDACDVTKKRKSASCVKTIIEFFDKNESFKLQ